MKRAREEISPSMVGKEQPARSVEGKGEKVPAGGSAVDATSSNPQQSSKKPAVAGAAATTTEVKDGDRNAPAASSSSSSSSRSGSGSAAGAGAGGAKAGAGPGKGAAAAAGEEEVAPPPDVEGIPNETLFVGNLSYRVSEAVIIKLFTPFGKVVREQFCYHKVGPRLGEPRGFCFVEYSNVDDAAKAIRALHGRKLYGRPLRVRFMTVEGKGRMDYSTTDSKGSTATSGSFGTYGDGAKIPPTPGAGGEAGAAAGVTKLSLDKKVALLKLKLREAQKAAGKR
ncbi:conserved unknown protein [Ectocarpus siliculosus]|uniref:RRM domain-containing protein n=1 Tax=Ectocarpus siliculosus TaxID=2880 RepID=D8LT06_ECTSI|nr:conserved unknown protein [Ectocarpus siliculosus]|eukprot:CBN75336.1 conserved unknown protein [Ectocarpus siliculosus]